MRRTATSLQQEGGGEEDVRMIFCQNGGEIYKFKGRIQFKKNMLTGR